MFVPLKVPRPSDVKFGRFNAPVRLVQFLNAFGPMVIAFAIAEADNTKEPQS